MHDACPYYEQLQYIMDTRLQVLFHFTLSRNTQMARKVLEDPDGRTVPLHAGEQTIQ